MFAQRVRKVSNGVISTIAGEGDGVPGFSGDNGPATRAMLNYPSGVAVDGSGNVYVADFFNNRVRILVPSGPPCPAPALTPTSLSAPASGGNLTSRSLRPRRAPGRYKACRHG